MPALRPLARQAARAALALGCLWAAPAHASSAPALHERLVGSTPAANETVPASPEALVLRFSQPVTLTLSAVELTGADSTPVPLGRVAFVADARTVLRAPVLQPLAPGRYRVRWRVVGPDGHPVRGTFAFTVGGATARSSADVAGAGPPGTEGPAPADSTHAGHAAGGPAAEPAESRGFGPASPAYVALRFTYYTATVLAIGAAIFGLVVLARIPGAEAGVAPEFAPDARRRAATLGSAAASALLPIAALTLLAQTAAVGGDGGAIDASLVRHIVAASGWGAGWMLSLTAAAVSLPAFRAARRGAVGGWRVAGGAALLLAAAPALAGHAAGAESRRGLLMAADAIHVLGAGAWIGTLGILALAALPAALALPSGQRAPAAAATVRAFSPVALIGAAALALTGLLAAFAHLPSLAAFLDTSYGRLLLRKLVLVAAVLALGGWHWLSVKPALGTEKVAGRLRRTSLIELAVAAAVLALTALLAATPPTGS